MSRWMMWRARAAVALAVVSAAGLGTGPAQAEVRALLVGVSGYPNLDSSRRLSGPRSDVQRMRDVLRARGVAAGQIEVLADGLPGAGEPTRANILDRLARLAGQAQRGDTVVLMFAGHGSRQPGARAEDPLEEIFLPLDVAGWDGRQRRVKNAIGSGELRQAVDRIGARGAFVWAIFDACHSARLVRGEEDASVRWRQITPQQLGIPAAELARAAERGAEPAPAADAGQSAFFYAAQAHEVTPELKLPAGVSGARVHGLFSHVLMQALERAGPISYRQLAQHVLATYRTLNDAQATPLFSGSALDAPVLGGHGAPVRQWPLERDGDALVLPAGALSGIGNRAVLAVLPGALATDAQRIGHLQVSSLQADRAVLAPAAHAGMAAPAAGVLRAGQYLRLVSNPPPLGLRLAWQRQGCAAGCALAQAATRLQRDGVPGVAAEWVDAAADAELLLAQRRDRIVLSAPGRDGDLAAVRLREQDKALEPDELAARLAVRLHTIARARNLLRVAARLVAEGPPSGVVATLQRRAPGGRALQALGGGVVGSLRNGDVLRLVVENTGPRAVDLTVLYLDADHGVVTLYPSARGETNRIEPGERRPVDQIEIHVPPAGRESLLLITTPSRRFGETRDYSFLEQPALSRVRGLGDDEDDLFADAAFATHLSRGGAQPAAPAAGLAVQLFSFDVQP